MIRDPQLLPAIVKLGKVVITLVEDPVAPSRYPLLTGSVILIAIVIVFIGWLEGKRAFLKILEDLGH